MIITYLHNTNDVQINSIANDKENDLADRH